MLNPSHRSLNTSFLIPPVGMIFDEAILTTYSLDPSVLLEIPVYLSLLATDSKTIDPYSVLASIKKLKERITIFSQRGLIQVPKDRKPNPVFSYLEDMIIESESPRGGVFHPKIWLLRFINGKDIVYRLVVLSRNLTRDNSWDIALQLDGHVGKKRNPKNDPIIYFLLNTLNRFKDGELKHKKTQQINKITRDLNKVQWCLPEGFNDISFYFLDQGPYQWNIQKNEKLLIISPFCSDAVLKKLASSSKTCFLLTREEELLALKPATLKAFDQEIYTLADGLVDDDDTNDDQNNNFQVKTDQILTKGLHAKAYIYEVLEDGESKTHVVVGSANATDAALTCKKNDEILVELVSDDSELINVDHFLSSMKANGYLTQYDDLSAIGDSSLSEDDQLLEEIRKWICSTSIRGYCTFDETSNYWNYVLNAEGMNTQNNYQDYETKVWPITLDEKRAQSWNISKTNENIAFSNLTSTAISSLIAFEIRHKLRQEQARFVLKITVSDLPSDRDAEILRTLINNKEGFLQYLRILLGYVYATDKIGTKNGEADFNWLNRLLDDETTLFEDLFVIYMKEPERLQDIQKLVNDLGGEDSAHIPKEFIQLWNVFEQAIKGKK
ncbi:phospholipase D family protein [Acinetobacter baumannii]|nr:phospholipase D family protein [Acinetobacter baumannii]